MKTEFIYIILKLSMYKGNIINLITSNFNGKLKIINFHENILLLVRPDNYKFEINELVRMEIFNNGIFKMSGTIINLTEDNIKIKLKNDFQYVTKRKDFRLPLLIPISINDSHKGILIDYNKKRMIGVLTFSDVNFEKNSEVDIKVNSNDKLSMIGQVFIKRDEIFNLKRYIIKLKHEDEELREIFDNIYNYYI